MTLTPFEKAEQRRKDSAFISAAIATTEEMLRVINESRAQFAAYKDFVQSGEQVTDVERDLTAQAVQDSQVANQTLVTIATLMEEKFGISA